MKAIIQPGKLFGSLQMPPSKSVMQRVCAAIWARGGSICIFNPGNSADDAVLLGLLRSAGAQIMQHTNGSIQIETLPAREHHLEQAHFGASGLAARMCIPILALAGHEVQLTADDSLVQRPMNFFADVLPMLGVDIAMEKDRLPATISGMLTPCDITVDGALSSQFITGLLIAYSAADARDISIRVQHLVSRPYIQLTLDIMQAVGLSMPVWQEDDVFYFKDASQDVRSGNMDFTVEGDWSAAAFWLVAGAIAGPLSITGLDIFSTQGDKAVLQALMECGASLSIEEAQITIQPAPLKAFHFNATDTPDLFPPLAALALYCEGTSVIEGVSRLAAKESNRAATIISELTKMGADISVQDEWMIIRGGRPLHRAVIDAHSDHRIAMMGAVAGLGTNGETIIEGAEAVRKSYPHFFEDLRIAGGRVALSE